jgi:mono/diheme cytochrome c family protein
MKQSKNLIYIVIFLIIVSIILTYILSTKSKNEDTDSVNSGDVISDEKGPEQVINGKLIYQNYCQTCHALDKQFVGPPLRNFSSRGPWVKKENIYKFIHNPALFAKNNTYTQKLIKEYNGVLMQAFPTLTKAEIDALVDYTNSKPNN